MAGYFAKPPAGSLLRRGHPLANGLMLAWVFDQQGGTNSPDMAGGRPGTLVNFPTVPTWTTGPRGRSLSFDGTDDVVRTVAPAWVYPLTVAALVRPSSLPAESRIAGFAESANNNAQLGIGILSTGAIKAADEGSSGAETNATSAAGLVAAGDWCLIAGVYSGVSLRTVWLNGTQRASNTTTRTGTLTQVDRFAAGRRDRSSPVHPFAGLIDAVYWWNRALTATDQEMLAGDPFCMFRRRRVPMPLKFVAPLIVDNRDATGIANATRSAPGIDNATRSLAGRLPNGAV